MNPIAAGGVLQRWPLFLTTFTLLGLVLAVPRITAILSLRKIPLAGEELGSTEKRRLAYLGSARRVYQGGYRKYEFWNLEWVNWNRTRSDIEPLESPVIVVSPKYLPELKKLPDNILSMAAAVDETMETKYTRIETDVPIIPHTIKASLTPALARLNPTIHTETKEALAQELPKGSEWEEVDIHHVLLRVVAMVSGRVFIGPELCRTEEYMDAAINYTTDVMAAQRAVQNLRPWLRPLLAGRLPQVQKLDQRIKEADAFMNPFIEKRKASVAGGQEERHDDMLQWLMDSQGAFPDKASQNLAKSQLGLGFAAIHTTTLTATNAFFDLVALPDFIPQLLEEAQTALDENNGVFTSPALQSMKKMDSVLKEVLRLSPASMASFQRKVLTPFTLPNGQHIPAGVTIEVPAVAVNSDSSVFPTADKFDPLRFYDLRQQARDRGAVEAAAQNQFVSVSQDSLTFGYGRHACPGRFFAANEIKMILAVALMGYEFKMPGDSTTRYPNIEFAHMCIPDFSKRLLCRKKE